MAGLARGDGGGVGVCGGHMRGEARFWTWKRRAALNGRLSTHVPWRTVALRAQFLGQAAGLSPEIKTLDQIRTIPRNQEIPHEGAFCDLMWSDPEDIEAWQVSPRGAGWLFGYRVTNEFNRINRLDLIARSHQLVQEGYKYFFPDENLVTVWSAPNYCYRCGNVASILSLDDKRNRDFKIFNAVPDEARVFPPRTTMSYFL